MITAEATRPLAAKMRITWIIDLPKQGSLFRLRVRLTGGKQARDVEWFPSWAANWQVDGGAQWVRWWRALEYDRNEQALTATSSLRLGSRLHSSEDGDGGVNPYWIIGGQSSRMYFGLQWSGGWRAIRGSSPSVAAAPSARRATSPCGEGIQEGLRRARSSPSRGGGGWSAANNRRRGRPAI